MFINFHKVNIGVDVAILSDILATFVLSVHLWSSGLQYCI